MLSVKNSTERAGMDQGRVDVLRHMLLIPTMIFLAVIELASRITERRSEA
jgi:hypothetical protein